VYYASMLRCWHLIWILVRTEHPCLGVGCHNDEGVLWYEGRICVPNVKELRDKILREAQESAYSIHPGGKKMYHDHKAIYWWYGMKRDIAEYVALCDTCQ
jgi:hypothetical protein